MVAAIVTQVARLIAELPERGATWLARSASLLVLPVLAGYFVRRRGLATAPGAADHRGVRVAAVVVNVYPYDADSDTELLAAAHLPVVLWFVVAYPYMGGAVRSHERRMDFVRFTGEWCIYFVLIALGGGVLMGLTAAILEPVDPDLAERVAGVDRALGRGGRRDRGRLARGVEAARRGEHGAGAHDALHPDVRGDAGRRRDRLRRDRAGRARSTASCSACSTRSMVVVLGLVLYGISAREPSHSSQAGWSGSSWSPSSARWSST